MALNPAQVQKFLGGVDYPASKGDLMEHARDMGADDNVLKTIRDLPYDEFNSPNDVSKAMGMI